MKKFLFIFTLYLLYSGNALAQVSQFVFITPEQRVGAGVISEAITIQSRNSAGTLEAVIETTDLLFQSTSPTGKFVTSSGKPTSKTMSKNTAKRTFYYFDSMPGIHTLTVKTTGRMSKKTFSLSQNIVVGNAVSVSTEVKPVVVPPTLAPEIIPIKTTTKTSPKKIDVVKPASPQKVEERATSTIEVIEGMVLAAVVYTAPPKTSALESFLWLPKKIWSAVKSVFQ